MGLCIKMCWPVSSLAQDREMVRTVARATLAQVPAHLCRVCVCVRMSSSVMLPCVAQMGGRVDILVNNAGIVNGKTFLESRPCPCMPLWVWVGNVPP